MLHKGTEELLTKIFHNTHDAIIIHDIYGRIQDVNDRMCKVYNLNKDEALSSSVEDLSSRNMPLHDLSRRWRKVLQGEKQFFEWEAVRPRDNSIFYVEISLEKLELSDRSLIIANIRDVTERKQKEEALRRSESFYRSIFETSGSSMMILDMDTTILQVNHNFEKISGYSREEIEEKMSWTEFVYSEDLQWMKEYHFLRRSDPDAAPKEYEFRYVTRSGDIRNSFLTIDLIPETFKSVVALVDITSRKKAEKALRRKTEEQALLLESVPIQIWYLTDVETYGAVNQAHAEFYGLSREEMEYRKLWDFLPEDEARVCRDGNIQVFQTGEQIRTEEWLHNASGEQRLVEIIKTPKLDASGKVEYVVCSGSDITERKQMEQSLRRETAFSQAVVRNLPGIFYMIDQKGHYVRWNSHLEEVTGYEQDSLRTVQPTELFPSDEKALIQQKIQQVFKEGSATVEAHLLLPSGETCPYYFTGYRVELEDGTYLLGIGLDITQRKQAEQALQESEANYRLLAENSPDLIWTSDLEGRYTFVSPAMRNMFGYAPEEAIGLTFFDHLHKEDADYISEYKERAIRESADQTNLEPVYSFELRQIRRDGSLFWSEVLASPLRDESGKIVGFQGATRDISQRKRTEHELKETKERLDVALQVTNTGLWDWNIQTGEVVLNEPWATMVGYSLDELKPLSIQTWMDLCHPDDLEVSNALVKQHMDGETEIYQCEARMRHKQGHWIWVLDRGKVIERHESGNPMRMIGTHTDITERKQLEEKLKQMSFHDSLTGLYNRNFFEEEMKRLSDDRYSPMGIIVCDVDGLKFVNDTLGHQAGDRMLISAANILRRSFRSSDIIARIGGDEFGVLLPQTGREPVERMLQRVRGAVQEYDSNEPEIPLALSLGHAVDETAADLQAHFREADNRMYREKIQREGSARSAILQALTGSMQARDFNTQGHCDRLQELASLLASSLELSHDSMNDLYLLARFHDLGKVGIPDSILFKQGALTEEEWQHMRQHCEIGHRIASSVPDLKPIADLILKHHEWWNGGGYPQGLSDHDIPLPSRILAIVDAYDAMTSERPYRRAMSREDAIAELRRCAGTQFDPDLVERFILVLPEVDSE